MEGKIQIEVNGASFAYEKARHVIRELTFRVREGESVGLIGANGIGKSTILKMLTGLLDHEGSIRLFGMEVCRENLPKIRRRTGYVFQDSDSQLFMPTVYDDLAFAPRNYGLQKEEVERCVDEALARAGIMHLKHKQNYKMSGGEKRMACIATILAMKPEVILMDEPSIALDPYSRRILIRTLNEMQETKVIASHDLDMILETCDRVILLNADGIAADGEAEKILRNRELLESCRLELPLCLQGYQRRGKQSSVRTVPTFPHGMADAE